MSQIKYESESDMAAYLDPSYGHGLAATYTRNGVNTSLNLILHEEYVELDEGSGVEAVQPIAYCRSIDIPNVTHNDTLADRKSTRLNSSHTVSSYAVFCLKKTKRTCMS